MGVNNAGKCYTTHYFILEGDLMEQSAKKDKNGGKMDKNGGKW